MNITSKKRADNVPIGIKMLETMMKIISKAAKLENIYTNHCIRTTSITILDQAGHPARHIVSVSGHRSEASVQSYSKTSAAKRQEMSADLSARSSSCVEEEQPSTSTSRRESLFCVEEEQQSTSTSRHESLSCFEEEQPSTSTSRRESAQRMHQRSGFKKYLKRQRRPLAERFDLNTFVPNFNLHSVIMPDSDEDADDDDDYNFGNGGNVYHNCTFNMQPVTINKVVNKRKRIMIESDSSQE